MQEDESEERGRRHRRTISENKPLRKFPIIGSGNKENDPSAMSGSTFLVPPRRARSATPREAPILTRMVQAQTRFDTATKTENASLGPETPSEDQQKPSASALSTRLMEMFGFDKPEKVLVEYACTLVQSMLLQGYMYVTEGHICFYAYLPKRSSVAIKSGYLSKRGRNNPKYNRYWFVLKGDVFSYYADSSNLYFPHGHVDLRYGISASLAEPKTKGAEVKDFQVTTDQRTYYFRADSATSAKEWVKGLQKVIFRTHNEGDSVKVSFPIGNVIDLEESPMTEFAETFKIRVLDSSETYAIDEVMFSPRQD
jgi:sterol 3beta-glucosyltransferase